jgi:hypothetical protein
MKQAEWNDITWGTTGHQMAHLKSFKISQKLKTEEQENEKTGNKSIIKSLEPEVLNISYSTGFAVGIDPRGEFEMLKKCAGMQDVFLLGGQKISKTNFSLDEIQLSNTILDNNGRILTGDLTLNFNTNTNTSSKGGKGTKNNTGTKAKKSGSLTLTPEDYAKARALAKEAK